MEPTPAAALSVAGKIRCGSYAAISIAALVATWSQNLAYLHHPQGFGAFLDEARVTAASRSVTADILLFALAAAVLMVSEARKHGIKYVWLYIAGGAAVAISVTFPLFLIARELRVGRTDTTRLGRLDTVGLTAVAVVTAALTVWVDAGGP